MFQGHGNLRGADPVESRQDGLLHGGEVVGEATGLPCVLGDRHEWAFRTERGDRGGTFVLQPTSFHSWHRLVLKYSPLLSVTRPGPSRLLLAMMERNSPLASFARSQ